MKFTKLVGQLLLLALLSESVPDLSKPEDIVLSSTDIGQLTCNGRILWWSGAADNTTTLTVNTTGSYYCTVEHNNTLLRTCPAHVSLVEFKPPDNAAEQTIKVFEKSDVVLTACQNVTSVPPAQISWRKTGSNELPRKAIVLPSGNLRISGAAFSGNKNRRHDGVYICTATNSVSGENWTSPPVTVTKQSESRSGEFQSDTPVNITATTGEKAVLECVVDGDNILSITWTPFPNNSTVNRAGQGGILTIRHVTIDHEGVYTCSFNQSYNGETVTGERQYYLTVIDPPRITNFTLEQTDSQLKVTCVASGKPTPEIMLNTPSGMSLTNQGNTLTVTAVTSGIYQCVVISEAGCARHELDVDVPTPSSTIASHALLSTSMPIGVVSSAISLSSHIFSSISTSHIPSMSSVALITSHTPSKSSVAVMTSHTPSMSSVTVMTSHTPSMSSLTSSLTPSSSIFPSNSLMSSQTSSVEVISNHTPSSSIALSSSLMSSQTSSVEVISSHTPSSSSVALTSSHTPSSSIALSSSLMSSQTSSVEVISSHTPSSSSVALTSSHTPSSSIALSSSLMSSQTSSVEVISSHTPSSSSVALTSSHAPSSSIAPMISSSFLVSSQTSSVEIISSFIPASSSVASIYSHTPSMEVSTLASHVSTVISVVSSAVPAISSRAPVATPTPQVTIPTSEVGGVKLTWVSGNTLLVKWDRVTTDDIIGYKISWVAGDVMSGKVINTLSSFHTFVDDRFLTSGNVTVLMWTYNSAGDGPISMTTTGPSTQLPSTSTMTSPTPSRSSLMGSTSTVTSHTPSSDPLIGPTSIMTSPTPSSSSLIGSISTMMSPTPSSSPLIGSTSIMTSPTPSSSSLIGSTSTMASPSPSSSPAAITPITKVSGIKLTWVKDNSVLVEWDRVISDDIKGYKLHWSSQSNESINRPIAALTAENATQLLIDHSNKELMDVIELYVYIWTYNLAGDGPDTYSSIIKPFTNLQCTNLSSFAIRYQWTKHVVVTRYQVSYHCSRTGSEGREVVTTPFTEKTFNAQPDCIYTVTLKAEGHDGYLLNCYTTTPVPKISAEIPKNQSFDKGFWIYWKFYNMDPIPDDLNIVLKIQVGDQQVEIRDPTKLSEYVQLPLALDGDSVQVSITMSVGNDWTDTATINVTEVGLVPPVRESQINDDDDDGITWIFYVAAFCAVVIVVLLVIILILALKHVQMRRREMDKITNHREKIMATFKHESNGVNNQSETGPKYIVV
ncbi:uncharacterized protein [Dysidea avara]|uniref:uncharacterized protein isoform X2 n=1 Tax=Dysidea avara TaxID=196820 RepID=UPI00331C18C3